MSNQTNSIILPERFSRQKLSALYKTSSIDDEAVKLLRKYLKAMANLYGLVSLQRVYEIINEQNPGLLTEAAFCEYLQIAQHEQEYFVIPVRDEQDDDACMSRYLMDLCLTESGEDAFSVCRSAQGVKPYYIPEKTVLLRYSDPFYEEPTKQSKALKNFLSENLSDSSRDSKSVFEDLQSLNRAWNFSMDEVVSHLQETSLRTMTAEQWKEFTELFLAMHNHTRMQYHCGHTPNEIREIALVDEVETVNVPAVSEVPQSPVKNAAEYNEMVSSVMLMDLPNQEMRTDLLKQLAAIRREMRTDAKQRKIGRNEPCPCGSGKKYKKCCGR